ncbi:MAG TPA: GIY-YIG nuclease family protein [Azospirillaceae bacterium]|nr:GIY-YIG nuclease family protein [Azospirillaceae bacterium]
MIEKKFYVYIMASDRNGTLYIGITSDLARRVEEHRTGALQGFTSRYGVRWLVYYEVHDDAENAILREKRLKEWKRAWKLRLIEKDNPDWIDLWETLNH